MGFHCQLSALLPTSPNKHSLGEKLEAIEGEDLADHFRVSWIFWHPQITGWEPVPIDLGTGKKVENGFLEYTLDPQYCSNQNT